jgi:DNA-binding transcriptional MerR regulator
MPPDTEPRYSLTELADLASVTPRTIRYYITQGLLRGPASSGPGAKYDDTDLARLRLIKRLQAEHQPLAEIRTQLDALGDAAILQLQDEVPAPPLDSALDYIRRITGGSRAAEAPAMYRMQSYADAPPAPTAPAAPAPAPSMAPPSPIPDVRLERSQWERIDLAPDVELHIRRPLARATAKRVDRLIAIARDLLEEDPS